MLYVFFARPTQRIVSFEGATMGTTWSVQVVSSGKVDAAATGLAIQQLLDRFDHGIFSTWDPASELSRLNRQAAGVPVSVSPELFAVLALSRAVHARSGGAFDISVGALVNLWGFGPAPVAGTPPPDAIAAALEQSGLDALVLDAGTRTVTLRKPLVLDLSGIAKGYAVDAVAALLQTHVQTRGHAAFLVEVGGELRLQGKRPDGTGWRIAVETPSAGSREVFARIDSRGEALALAGSGGYRNFREADGKLVSHGIDPRSGYPVEHKLASVTVLAATAAEADAWATALMVLGPEAGPALADREGLAAYFIMRAPEGWLPRHTDAFAPYLKQ